VKPSQLHLRRRQWLTLLGGFALSGLLLAVDSAFPDDGPTKVDPRVDEVRKDLQRYAQLVREAKQFFALPPERQEALRKLDDDLGNLPSLERARLMRVMTWYANWLDKLSPADRDVILSAPDKTARLAKIKEQLERDWIARQPRATQQYLARLPRSKPAPAAAAAHLLGMMATRNQHPLDAASALLVDKTDIRAETIRRLKRHESAQARDWLIASRFWQDLAEPDPKKRQPMPTRASEFSADVDNYVKDYLRPVLSKEELERLDKAEGHWPQYALTLVEVADRHPLALPQKHGPESFATLPKEVRDRVQAHYAKEPKETKKGIPKKAPEVFFRNQAEKKDMKERLEQIDLHNPSMAIKFACAVAQYAHKGNVQLPFELWAARPEDMSARMKAFLDPDGAFMTGLTTAERMELKKDEKKWPEYPLKVKRLAEKYGFTPPWHVLPEPAERKPGWDPKHGWDYYRLKPIDKLQSRLPASPVHTFVQAALDLAPEHWRRRKVTDRLDLAQTSASATG
jgi:hypothetical protein